MYNTPCAPAAERQNVKKRGRELPNPVRTPELVAQVAQTLEEDQSQTICGLARDHGLSERTMERVVKEDLGLASYARPRRHKIAPGTKQRWLERAKKLLNHLKNRDRHKVLLFSDEKWFTLAPYSSRRNDEIIWCKGGLDTAPEELRYVEVCQREAGAMFLGIIASDGKVGPPI